MRWPTTNAQEVKFDPEGIVRQGGDGRGAPTTGDSFVESSQNEGEHTIEQSTGCLAGTENDAQVAPHRGELDALVGDGGPPDAGGPANKKKGFTDVNRTDPNSGVRAQSAKLCRSCKKKRSTQLCAGQNRLFEFGFIKALLLMGWKLLDAEIQWSAIHQVRKTPPNPPWARGRSKSLSALHTSSPVAREGRLTQYTRRLQSL